MQHCHVPTLGGEWYGGCPCSVRCSRKSWFGFQELEAIKAKVREMEKEDERLKELQLEAESRLIMSSEAGMGCPWVLLPPPRDTSGTQGDDRSQGMWLCLSRHPGSGHMR